MLNGLLVFLSVFFFFHVCVERLTNLFNITLEILPTIFITNESSKEKISHRHDIKLYGSGQPSRSFKCLQSMRKRKDASNEIVPIAFGTPQAFSFLHIAEYLL